MGFEILPPTCVKTSLGEININNYYYLSLTNANLNGQIHATQGLDAGPKSIVHYTVSAGPFNGSVTLDELTGAFVYIPNTDYAGMDYFKVMAWNQYGEQKEIVVSIQVNGDPIVEDEIYTVIQNRIINGEVNAIDPLSTTLSYAVATQGNHGIANFVDPLDPHFTYTQNPLDLEYIGSDSFIVSVTNGLGLVSLEEIRIQITPIYSSEPTVGVNPLEYNLLINHTIKYFVKIDEANSDTYTYHISNDSTTIGTISDIVITPDTKEATFDYTGIGLGIDKINITVDNNNTGKSTSVINDIVVQVSQNVSNISQLADNVVAPSGTTEGTFLVRFYENSEYSFLNGRYYITSKNGIVRIEPNLLGDPQPFIEVIGQEYKWSYIANSGSYEDSVETGIKFDSTIQHLTYDIQVSTLPVIIDKTDTTRCIINSNIKGKIMALDPYNGSLIFQVLVNPQHGVITFIDNDGNYTYEPNLNYVGPDQFVIGASNGYGTTQVPLALIVFNPLLRPIIYDFQPNPAITYLNFTLAGQLFVDYDILYPISYSISLLPMHGVLIVDANGLWEYTPDEGYLGEDAFEITVTNTLSQSDSITIPVTVSTVTLAPVIYSSIHLPIDTYDDTPVNFIIKAMNPLDYLLSFPLLGPLIYLISVQGTKGVATIDATGKVEYTPDGLSIGIDKFEVTVENELGLKDTTMVYVNILNAANPY